MPPVSTETATTGLVNGVLAVTGYDSFEIKSKIIDSGADDYLGKPLDYKQTLEKICRLLGVKPTEPTAK